MEDLAQGPVGFNSCNMSCWQDEDFIGKVARLARTCHFLTQSVRTIEKLLGMYHAQFMSL